MAEKRVGDQSSRAAAMPRQVVRGGAARGRSRRGRRLRSFAEPAPGLTTNRAEDDRSLLWGVVDVKPAAAL